MSVLDKAKLDEVARVFRARFLNADLGVGDRPLLSLLAQEIPVSGSQLKPKFASRQFGVDEWIADRKFGNMKNFDFAIDMKTWSNGLRMKVEELEDDENALALYGPEIDDMRDDFEEHREELIVDLLSNGFAGTLGTIYDGQFLFDSDHQDFVGQPVQSNVDTPVLADASFRAAREGMWGIRKPNGKLAKIVPDTLIIPVALSGVAEGLFEQRESTGGGTNTLFGVVKVVVDARLDANSTTAWFLLDSRKTAKPMIMGNRKAVGFRSQTDPEQGVTFERNEVRFGGDARYNAGYAYWQAIFGSDGSV